MNSISSNSFMKNISITALLLVNLTVSAESIFEMRGNIEVQARYFTQDALLPTQKSSVMSLAIEPEFFFSWNDDADSLEFVPFARIDQHDDERTHTDIRELSWVHVTDNWETRVGIRRVFWGVTEFQHLVDIINQSDAVEDIDNEDKLGQPMINLSLVKDWGIIDFYVLPGFRERTFSSTSGRPAIAYLQQDHAIYEHSDKDSHVDFAVRWTHSMGDFDLGLSWFDGTSRDPLIIASPHQTLLPEIIPYYQQISQVGIDIQATIGDVLWKFEVINNQNNLEDYSALQGGFEYSLYGISGSNADLGLLFEYGWDERGAKATGINQNDIFTGARLALNNADSSELLFGISYDLDYQSSSLFVEASKRFGNNMKASLDIRLFDSDDQRDPIYLFKQDDHLQLTVQYFY